MVVVVGVVGRVRCSVGTSGVSNSGVRVMGSMIVVRVLTVSGVVMVSVSKSVSGRDSVVRVLTVSGVVVISVSESVSSVVASVVMVVAVGVVGSVGCSVGTS